MIDAKITEYYEQFAEESRLESGPGCLEFERTAEILGRVLPRPPARILDVGGAAGVYSAWLTERGYEVHLIDASPRLVGSARERNARLATPIASIAVGDARAMAQPDAFAAAVLLMGPLYHLQSAADRAAALNEARRVLTPGGTVVVAAISRYASALDGLARQRAGDPAFVRMRDRDLHDGHHLNETGHPEYFTTAYFHRPADLRAELQSAGFENVHVLGVEGPGWIVGDFDARWADDVSRNDLMHVARALESEESIVGASAHLLGIGRRSADDSPVAIEGRSFEWGTELPTLRGRRIDLRWLTHEDAAAFFEIFGDPEVMRFWSSPPHANVAEARGYIDGIHAHFRARQLFQWGVRLRESRQIIGTTTLYDLSVEHGRAQVGFALRRDKWGQGFATDVLDTVIGFAFDTLGLNRLEADVDPENERSLATLERQGFRREGYMRERWQPIGERRDTVFLGLLRREWVRDPRNAT
jgi:RimJ/RimL family protein N-acetyltransferase/ubiquinone/menaquinone biosynthesis C-methylase UbiE